jgi:hypothetical protein
MACGGWKLTFLTGGRRERPLTCEGEAWRPPLVFVFRWGIILADGAAPEESLPHEDLELGVRTAQFGRGDALDRVE